MSDYSDVKWKDNGKLKLLIIVGTRPEIIRLSAVINKARRYFDTVLEEYRRILNLKRNPWETFSKSVHGFSFGNGLIFLGIGQRRYGSQKRMVAACCVICYKMIQCKGVPFAA